MIKKITLFLLMFTSVFMLVSCDNGDSQVAIPSLARLTKKQAMEKLNEVGLKISIYEEVNNKIPEGTFSRFEEGITEGKLVERESEIIAYFAIHKNILPDMNGLTRNQIIVEFTYVDFEYEIEEVETDIVENNIFLEYLNYQAGTELPAGTRVIVKVGITPYLERYGLIISKYIEGKVNNKAIELYNASSEELDMSNFSLNFYLNGSTEATSLTFPEGLVLKSRETYLIVNNMSDEELQLKADLKTTLPFDGNDAIAIMYKEKVLDVIGNIGWAMYILNDVTLVRDTSIVNNSETFNSMEWNTYISDYYEIAGIHPVSYPQEFTILPQYLSLNYFDDAMGVVEVTHASTNDGDTASFSPYFLDGQRIRFIGVDTPELGESNIELRLVASEAKSFTNSRLNGASKIHIQHDPSTGSRQDTYDRYLGLVWYDGRLLNYELVLNGYSSNMYNDPDNHFIYHNISLTTWFQNAENYARTNKLGIWGVSGAN